MSFKEYLTPINENSKNLIVSQDIIDIWRDDIDGDHTYIVLNKNNIIKKGKYPIINEGDDFITVKMNGKESELLMDDILDNPDIFKIK